MYLEPVEKVNGLVKSGIHWLWTCKLAGIVCMSMNYISAVNSGQALLVLAVSRKEVSCSMMDKVLVIFTTSAQYHTWSRFFYFKILLFSYSVVLSCMEFVGEYFISSTNLAYR